MEVPPNTGDDHEAAYERAKRALFDQKALEADEILKAEDNRIHSHYSQQSNPSYGRKVGQHLSHEYDAHFTGDDPEAGGELARSFLQLNLTEDDTTSTPFSLPGSLPPHRSSNQDQIKPPVTEPTISIQVPTSNLKDQEQVIAKLDNNLKTLEDTIRQYSIERPEPTFSDDQFFAEAELKSLKAMHLVLSNSWPSEGKGIKRHRTRLLGRVSILRRDLGQMQGQWTAKAESLPSSSGHNVYDAAHHFRPLLHDYHAVVQLVLLLVTTLQVITHASRREGTFLLAMITLIVKLSLECHPSSERSALGIEERTILRHIPKQPDTAVKHFALEPKYTIYAVCPSDKCHKLHAPVMDSSGIPQYPQRCSGRQGFSSPCEESLTKPQVINGHTYHKPIKRYIVFSIADWISGLMSRPGYEDMMDKIWDRTRTTNMEDIFDGEFLRTFKGPDGRTLFREGVTLEEAHYAISMSLDFFNPRTNKSGGKSVSSGVVSLVNLNLRPEERYKPENMCVVAIIPGPKEPSVSDLNPYLAPIVDQLLEFWKPGVKISRTCKSQHGRLVLLALVILICDLPAARKTAGYTSHSHERFCSVCHITKKEHGENNTDQEAWRFRTDEEYRATASIFNALENPTARDNLANLTGVRWSELTRLEYFDMVKCVAVDAMHNLFLGIVKEHYRILGIGYADSPQPTSKKTKKKKFVKDLKYDPPSTFSTGDCDSLRKLQTFLNKPLIAKIQDPLTRNNVLNDLSVKFNLKAQQYLIEKLQCDLSSTKGPDGEIKPVAQMSRKECGRVLMDWRESLQDGGDRGGDTESAVFHVINKSELQQLRSSINSILKPSWISSLPSSLGEASHGKLKADQWRVLATVHLPLSLIRLWGTAPARTEREVRCKKIVDLTVKLTSAIVLATSHTIKEETPRLYFQLMKEYYIGIKELFPGYEFTPNSHMALHLDYFLRLFGPVHAWWTFPFERAIGMLQRIPTNPVLGDLEVTMALSFHRAARLRAAFSSFAFPASFAKARSAFLQLVAPASRHVVFSDGEAFSPLFSLFGRWSASVEGHPDVESGSIDTNTYDDEMEGVEWTTCDSSHSHHDLLRRFQHPNPNHRLEIATLSSYQLRGARYGPCSRHKGNSQIIFRSYDGVKKYGQVAQIVNVRSIPLLPPGSLAAEASSNPYTTVFLVRQYHVHDHEDDPYRAFPVLRACALTAFPHEDLQPVLPSQIIAHFAALPTSSPKGKDILATISLSRDV